MTFKTVSGVAAALLIAGAFNTSTTMAATTDQSGWYIGGSIGSSTIKPEESIRNLSYTESTKDTGFKIYGGYQFNPYIAVEGQYINLGQYKLEGTGRDKNLTASADVSGVSLNAVGSVPLGDQFALIGKLGVIYSKLNEEISYTGSAYRGSYSSSKTIMMAGVGAEYKFNNNLSLRAEYEYYGSPVAPESDGATNLRTDMISLGLRYRF